MNGCEQQWTLVVVVWLGVLTLFTVNGHPFVERNIGLGINDDPAENRPLSLSERHTDEKSSDVATKSENDSETTLTTLPISPNIATTVGGSAIAVNATVTENVILSQVSASKTNLTTAASPLENVTIIAATTAQAGNLPLTSILRSSVNIEINPSQTTQNAPKNSGINMATYTSSLKPSFTKTPTENSSSAKLSAHISAPTSLSPSKSASINIKVPVNASSAVVAGLSSPVLNSANSHSSVTANKSSIAPTGDDLASTLSSQGPSSTAQTSAQQSSQGPSNVPFTQITSVPLSTNSPSGVPTNNKQSELPSSYTATNVPSTGSQSTQNPEVSTDANTKPLIETSPKLPSTGIPSTVPSTVPSTGPESLPPTSAPPQKDTGKPTTLANEEPSTKDSVAASTTMGSSTAIPEEPTTNAVPETTKEATTNAVPVTTKEVTTNAVPETAKEVTTNAVLETTTKATSAALETTKEVTTNAVPETTKEVTTNGMSETTKEATTNVVPEITKEATTKEKATAVETKTKSQNNDEEHRTPPDQGREAVLWDFIVPVAIGMGVALAIALGVVFVRTCRRRKLVKVRFGGKPSHPRLLNNDLINLLAESDDEEE